MKRFVFALFGFLILNLSFARGYVNKAGDTEALANCSHLTYEEKEYADQLSALHRDLFCRRFSKEQRKQAMAISKEKNTPSSADEGVEAALKSSQGQDQVDKNLKKYYNSPCSKKRYSN